MPDSLTRLSGKRLLIVRPGGELTPEVTRRLKELGARIAVVTGGPEQVARHIKQQHPDAAIVDLDVPATAALWFDQHFEQSGLPTSSPKCPHRRLAGGTGIIYAMMICISQRLQRRSSRRPSTEGAIDRNGSAVSWALVRSRTKALFDCQTQVEGARCICHRPF